MKVSVSLPDDDVFFIDDYAHRRGNASRSSVVHRAVELLRLDELELAYENAWDEWAGDGADLWDRTAADGLADASR